MRLRSRHGFRYLEDMNKQQRRGGSTCLHTGIEEGDFRPISTSNSGLSVYSRHLLGVGAWYKPVTAHAEKVESAVSSPIVLGELPKDSRTKEGSRPNGEERRK